MKYITGTDRSQMPLLPMSLDEMVEADADVRMIDLFVQSLDLAECGFNLSQVENGRPSYHPADLLKLFLFGYMNRTRSSRALERECKRNIELRWLMRELVPDHNTIANFRRDNATAIREVFRSTVRIAKHFNLIGASIIAGDSTKLRAQNSKKNNYNQAKINRHLEYIDRKIDEYQQELEKEDSDIDPQKLNELIDIQRRNKQKYKDISVKLDQTGDVQHSSSDPDSRQMIIRNHITEVAYNVQTTVDSEYNMPVDFLVTNENDSKAMGKMLERAVDVLGNNEFVAIYDKGYHTGSEFLTAEKLGVTVIVAAPEVSSHAPDFKYDVEHFEYNSSGDYYLCPQGYELHTNGRFYTKERGRSQTLVKHYKTQACRECPVMEMCTRNKEGRLIERSEYADLIEANKLRLSDFQELYKKRQQIVEHPFGTMKRQWDFSYVMTKRFIHRASADIGLIFTSYNLRRLLSILDPVTLKRYFSVLIHSISLTSNKSTSIRPLKPLSIPKTINPHKLQRVA